MISARGGGDRARPRHRRSQPTRSMSWWPTRSICRLSAASMPSKGRDTVRSLPLAISDLLMAEDLGEGSRQPFLYLGAAFLAGSFDHHRSGIGQSSAQSHRQYRPARLTPGKVQNPECNHRKNWSRPHRHQREYVRRAHALQRHRTFRGHGRAHRSGARRRSLRRSGPYHHRRYGALLARDQRRRNHRKRNCRAVPAGDLILCYSECKRYLRERPAWSPKIDPIVNVMESRSNEALVCMLRCPRMPWRSLKALGGFPPLRS